MWAEAELPPLPPPQQPMMNAIPAIDEGVCLMNFAELLEEPLLVTKPKELADRASKMLIGQVARAGAFKDAMTVSVCACADPRSVWLPCRSWQRALRNGCATMTLLR